MLNKKHESGFKKLRKKKKVDNLYYIKSQYFFLSLGLKISKHNRDCMHHA